MRIIRIYSDKLLRSGDDLQLNVTASNHVLHVLRLKPPAPLIIFDAQGQEFHAQFVGNKKNHVCLKIGNATVSTDPESPLYLHLGQAISRSQAMDYSLQKSVELGVNRITPLLTEFNRDKYNPSRIESRMHHWRGIIISACEQSGRRQLPTLDSPCTLKNWLQELHSTYRLLLHPHSTTRLQTLNKATEATLLVGAEGGFSEDDIQTATQAGFTAIGLGPRILRTESAAPAAIAALQCLWGDF